MKHKTIELREVLHKKIVLEFTGEELEETLMQLREVHSLLCSEGVSPNMVRDLIHALED